MTPLVSVVIPLYNSAATVLETLVSLRGQSVRSWEAVVVNDGSTDEGPALVQDLARSEPRLALVHQANKGLAGARNGGLSRCAGKYLYFLDADDWLMPDGLGQLVATAEASPWGAAYGVAEARDADGRSLGGLGGSPAWEVGLAELLDHNPLLVHTQLIRRDVFGAARFDESLRVGEDYDMWLRLAHGGVRWRAVDHRVAAYRLRPASLSRNFELMLRTGQATVARAYQRAREHAPGLVADARPARERGVLRRMALEYATMVAIADPSPSQDRAAALLGPMEGGPRIASAVAAAAVPWAVLYGLCVRPSLEPKTAGLWWGPLQDWWRRCVADAWLAPDQVEEIMGLVVAGLVPHVQVARRLLASCGESGFTLVGYGRNGRCLGALARESGVPYRVRDDRFGQGAGPCDGSPSEPMEAPLGRGPVVISPLDDSRLVGRFHACPKLLRWSVVQQELAAEALRALRFPGSDRSPLRQAAADIGAPS